MTSDQCAPARKLDRIPKLFWHRPDLAGLRCPLLLSPSYKMNHGPLTRSGKTGKNSCLARISRHARGRGAAILDYPKADAGNADGLSSTLCRTAFPRRTPGKSRTASRRPRFAEIFGRASEFLIREIGETRGSALFAHRRAAALPRTPSSPA